LAIFARPATLSASLDVLCYAAMTASPQGLTANDNKIEAIVEKMSLVEEVGQMISSGQRVGQRP